MAQKKCIFCGKDFDRLTKDHVPPKSLFGIKKLKNMPKNLITVPSCHSCNQKGSKNDELFTVYISILSRQKNNHSKAHFQETALKILKKKKNIIKKNQMSVGTLKTNNGIIIDQEIPFFLPTKEQEIALAIYPTLERIVKGIYYKKENYIVSDDIKIEVLGSQFGLPKDFFKNYETEKTDIVNGVFSFAYLKAEPNKENPTSVFILEFFSSLYFLCHLKKIEDGDMVENKIIISDKFFTNY